MIHSIMCYVRPPAVFLVPRTSVLKSRSMTSSVFKPGPTPIFKPDWRMCVCTCRLCIFVEGICTFAHKSITMCRVIRETATFSARLTVFSSFLRSPFCWQRVRKWMSTDWVILSWSSAVPLPSVLTLKSSLCPGFQGRPSCKVSSLVSWAYILQKLLW